MRWRHGETLQRVTSLRRRAQDNAAAASYWFRRVLDDGGRRDWTSPSCGGDGGGACDAHTTALVNSQRCELIANSERKCADTIGTVPVPWAGRFQC